MKRFRRRREEEGLLIFHASDVHGSDLCWRKFLGAAKYYGADALVMGGDLTGKAVVPVVVAGDRFRASFGGEERAGTLGPGLDAFEDAVRRHGMYPWRTDEDGLRRHTDDDAARDGLFERVMRDELRRWVALADERLPATGAEAFVIAGNDDPWGCDEVLAQGRAMTFADDRVVRMGEHELLSLSYSNPTPWGSPRELDEDELYRRIARLADQLEDPGKAIFNLHVPPYGTGLDTACEIADDLSPVYEAGQPRMVPVGSRAVRQIIEERQPMLSLHGHIHESRGEHLLGRTLAINTGSEYQSGRLLGGLIKVNGSGVLSHQFVTG
jgi:Icc-related predicted phosphoesterase